MMQVRVEADRTVSHCSSHLSVEAAVPERYLQLYRPAALQHPRPGEGNMLSECGSSRRFLRIESDGGESVTWPNILSRMLNARFQYSQVDISPYS